MVADNPALMTPSLPALTTVAESLYIQNNSALTNLGLPMLTGSVVDFQVHDNPQLCGSLVAALEARVTQTGNTAVSGNDDGC